VEQEGNKPAEKKWAGTKKGKRFRGNSPLHLL